jgi:ABC-type phosphate transport system auxiliary subunit
MSLSSKTSKMSRLKQIQIIDTAIQSVASITQSQCSLSETDLIVLNEALERLQFLKRKKGKTNEQIRNEIVQVVALLVKFFKD